MHPAPLYGAIEAGGTKFICSVAREPGTPLATLRIPTTTPAATLAAVVDFFAQQQLLHGDFAAFGIASFGPVDLHPGSSGFGHILDTPKAHWSHTDLVTPFARRFGCPVAIDTDVNAAALAEATSGAGRGRNTVVYVTVGTGIGGGIYTNGHTHKGRLHPELGHIRVQRHEDDPHFAGSCPFHGDCLEGLASGPAIEKRYGAALAALPPEHAGFRVIGDYLGQLAATLLLVLAPDRILFGGGVMQQAALFPLLRAKAAAQLNGYAGLGDRAWLEGALLPAGLGLSAGIEGALLLAQRAS